MKKYQAKANAAAAAKGLAKPTKAQSPLKMFGSDLHRNGELRGQWEGWRANYIEQRADGRSRVSSIKEKVEKKHQTRTRMIAPKRKFYLPSAFLRTFKVDYKTLKLKIRTKMFKGKESKGIIANDGDEG
eukprot:6462113-Pyramimonas_sp.AAC.1